MSLPWAAGQIGDVAGLRWIFVLVALSYAGILGLSRAAAGLDGARPEATSSGVVRAQRRSVLAHTSAVGRAVIDPVKQDLRR
jgi:hypothetical protein